MRESINKKIKELRKEKGYSRTFLSKKVNIDYWRLVRIENENANITILELKSIADFLDVNIDYFFN